MGTLQIHRSCTVNRSLTVIEQAAVLLVDRAAWLGPLPPITATIAELLY